jgi:plastocyanin
VRKFLAALTIGSAIIVSMIATGAIGAAADQGNDGGRSQGQGDRFGRVRQVTVPPEDRFYPFALQIRAGDSVRWVNTDSDDHTVVSDDALNTAGPTGVDKLLPPDRRNAVTLQFNRPGTFVYYCRFHAKLDRFNQPVAPGPDGGIQDADGNFGTPMSGVITVLPRNRF